MPEKIAVKVALRCRPLIPRELTEGCQLSMQFVPNEPQVVVGKDKAFTFDHVFNTETSQETVYEESVRPLMSGLFNGYNATVLAYGQTGSGKTYTMGSGYLDNDNVGVIPRVTTQLFDGISERDEKKFHIKVSFLEIYNEELKDLNKPVSSVAIREDINGGIMLTGLSEVAVSTREQLMDCLAKGSVGRTTGATAMNETSSRSHAIFTIHVDCVNKEDSSDCWKAKFHLVDLAGSERVKKTGAEGERFREGVNINKGLLCLGNVISALGDENQKRTHVPYRDSKLTRILQDSLGGNSHTVMIACVSPADSNLEETITTLRYADRARKIKNKPIINRDPQTAEIMRLKQLVQQLQYGAAMMTTSSYGGAIMTTSSLSGPGGDVDIQSLIERNKKLEEENDQLLKDLQKALDQSTTLYLKIISAEMKSEENDHFQRDQLADSDDDVVDDDKTANTDPSLTMENSTEHTLKHARMNEQLCELSEMLNKKEDLVKQMTASDGKMVESLKQQYETTLKEMEAEIAGLQNEKEILSEQLLSVKSNINTSKVSEQRRQRLKELESQMAQLRKKMSEQAKLNQMREQTGKQVKKLNQEILQMKQTRVKLIKQMKTESDNFKKWKAENDKQMNQLKAKDRKRQCEVVKMKEKYVKEQSVLRRKAQEAAAANKRLKDAIDKQKKVSEERQQKLDVTSIGNRVKAWLGNEVDVQVALKEAKFHLDSLIQDRKEMTTELESLKDQINEPPAKKSCSSNSANESEPRDAAKQIVVLQNDLQFRNLAIHDLQEKIVDADSNNTSNRGASRWESVHSMVEAKVAMKWLFNTLINSKAQLSKVNSEVKEMALTKEEVEKSGDQLRTELAEAKQLHLQELHNIQQQSEDKVLFLLRQLHGSKDESEAGAKSSLSDDDEAKQIVKYQEAEIERLSSIQDQLHQKTRECEDLKKKLLVSSVIKPNFFTPVSEVKQKKKKLTKTKKASDQLLLDYMSMSDDESSEDDDDDGDTEYEQSDSDWHDTPYQPRRKRKAPSMINRCGCKTKCNTKICRCRKVDGQRCTEECGCNPDICLNRGDDKTQTLEASIGNNANSTFNVGLADTSADDFTSKEPRQNLFESKENSPPAKTAKKIRRSCAAPVLDLFKQPQPPTQPSLTDGVDLDLNVKPSQKNKKRLFSSSNFFDSPMAE